MTSPARPQPARPSREAAETPPRPRVVVLGGGFGGVAAAAELAGLDVDVTVVDREQRHVFQPLLYQVAVGRLPEHVVASDLRARVDRRVAVVHGTVERVDLEAREVALEGGEVLPYDRLVVALGAGTNWLGVPGASEHAVPLKDLRDATVARDHLAALFGDVTSRAAVVVVGAGPTGVELAGALADLRAAHGAHLLRISLVEAGPDLLPGYRAASREAALAALVERGVHVHTDEPVTAVTSSVVELASGTTLPADAVLWATGIDATPVATAVGLPVADRRVPVSPSLRLVGRDDVWVVGDLAGACDGDGALLPQLAPVAQQAGRHAAREIGRSLLGEAPRPFRYLDKGTLAIVADRSAVADLPFGVSLRGLPAWALWLGVHVATLPDPLDRVRVVSSWARRGARVLPPVRLVDDLAAELTRTVWAHVTPDGTASPGELRRGGPPQR